MKQILQQLEKGIINWYGAQILIEDLHKNHVVLDSVRERFTDEKLNVMAFEKYPRVIHDDYNPQDDANEEYREIHIEGAKDLLNAL